jgi:DNA processing protein
MDQHIVSADARSAAPRHAAAVDPLAATERLAALPGLAAALPDAARPPAARINAPDRDPLSLAPAKLVFADPVAAVGPVHPPPRDADRRALLVLHHAAEAGDPLISRLVRACGPQTVAAAVLAGSAHELLSAHDESVAAARASLLSRSHTLRTRCYRADPDADLATAAKSGARYVIPGDPDWPDAVDDLGDTAPLGLWIVGPADLRTTAARTVSIVGARSATGYGMHIAGEIAVGLAERGWLVVSGAARGIDGAAHRGALAGRGSTAAVLACGIDLVYPLGHEALLSAIAAEGVVVSELPPGTHVSRFRFLDRNRLIAALGRGTVVVEAAARSGSLVTARLADELSRPVLAVPGPVTSESSEGTHQLIRDGALLVTRAAEIVEHLGEFGADLAEPARPDAHRRPRDGLDPTAARVLDALPRAGRGELDTVEAALSAGLDPRTAHAALGRLAASGWADRNERGWFATRQPS